MGCIFAVNVPPELLGQGELFYHRDGTYVDLFLIELCQMPYGRQLTRIRASCLCVLETLIGQKTLRSQSKVFDYKTLGRQIFCGHFLVHLIDL